MNPSQLTTKAPSSTSPPVCSFRIGYVAVAVVFLACDESEVPGGSGGADAGSPDASGGSPDARPPDVGRVDAGAPDGARPDVGSDAEPPPVEGLPCFATTDETDVRLRQDDCPDGLVCANWDAYGRHALVLNSILPPPELSPNSVNSCVQICTTDDDCGPGRFCSEPGIFGAALEEPGFCVDRVAGVDEACHPSRLTELVLRDEDGAPLPRVGRGDELVGCEADLVCLHNLTGFVGSNLGFIHPDEGFCQAVCLSDGDCPAPEAPFCLPGLFTDGTGMCGARLPRGGSTCTEPDDDRLVNVANGCGFGDLECFGDAEGLRLCYELCSQTDPVCDETLDGPTLGAAVCSFNPAAPNAGVCYSRCRTTIIGSDRACPADQFCAAPFDLTLTENVVASAVTVCRDHEEPSLQPAVFAASGDVVSLGEACGGRPELCPSGHTCLPWDEEEAATVCAPVCDPTVEDIDELCGAVLGTPAECVMLDGIGFCVAS